MDYFPFLKAKMNEVSGVGELSGDAFKAITPFFDIPRPKKDNESETKKSIQVSKKHLERYFPKEKDFYLDVFDLNPMLKISGSHIYDWTLSEFLDPNLIPVLGLDRDPGHLKSVVEYFKNNEGKTSNRVCIRLLQTDFEDYELIEDDLKFLVSQVKDHVDHYDIAFDCRMIKPEEVEALSVEIKDFLEELYEDFNPQLCFVASSSIPPVASEFVRPSSEAHLNRSEKALWLHLSGILSGFYRSKLFYGDYGVVSPHYSDPDLSPGLFNTVSTPKALYTYDHGYFAIRGGSFKSQGRYQYHDLAQVIVSKSFFRGPTASKGDKYIAESALRLTTKGSAGTWIKNTLISHIEFVRKEINSGAL